MSALDVNGMEGSTNSMSYMLGLLLIALNCLLFEIASLAAHAELLVWSCPILMANISKHKCFQGRKECEVGWDVAPVLPQPQALHFRP